MNLAALHWYEQLVELQLQLCANQKRARAKRRLVNDLGSRFRLIELAGFALIVVRPHRGS